MSRRNRNKNVQQMSTGSNGQSGGGGSKLPITGNLNIQLGKRGLSVSGSNIQTVTVPLQHKQQQQQQSGVPGGGGFPWQQNAGDFQGFQQAIQGCILAASQQATASQQLLTSLTQLATMTMPTVGQGQGQGKRGRNYTAPQQQYQQQQGTSRKKQRQLQYA